MIVTFRDQLDQLEERKRDILTDAAQMAWPGEEFDLLNEVCVWWGDFRENRYERGEFAIGKRELSRSSQAVFNGTETTVRRPAFVNGQACVFVRTYFSPESGCADFGQAAFEPVRAKGE